MIFTVGFYGSMTVVFFYLATPRPSWGKLVLSHSFGPMMGKSLVLAIPFPAVGFVIDLYILIVPIVAVSRLQLAKKRKIGLYLVFGTGGM